MEKICVRLVAFVKKRVQMHRSTYFRPKILQVKVLGKYLYHLGSCTQCGLCVEACPFGAIRMNQEFELSNESVDSFEMTLNKKEGRG